jgi:NitT/TauT family transport system permease protein
MAMKLRIWRNNQFTAWQPNLWDVVALLLLFAIFVALAWGAGQMSTPYQVGDQLSISLSATYLPGYALRTTLRMFIALTASLLFTFVFGMLAAKNKHVEKIIIPVVDILQSVPVLGYLSIAMVACIALFPGSLMGPECAAILAIFTGQAWNMFLGFYQSLKTIPHDLREASAMFQLSGWQRFWRMEVPFAMPSLIWNMMMSMSASWFFITASEAITVNNQKILLPGIGSYIAVAIAHMNKAAVIYAIITMLIVILLYDQLLFRPLIAWSEKFKSSEGDEKYRPGSLLITILQRTRLLHYAGQFFAILVDEIINYKGLRKATRPKEHKAIKPKTTVVFTYVWYGLVSLVCLAVLIFLLRFVFKTVSISETLHVLTLGVYTTIRIIILIIICSLIWVPVGVWIGLRPRVAQIAQPIAQFLAAFPANLLFPIVVVLILRYKLNVEIWTTPLMILGAQWYILFNVIAGTTALPKDLVQVADNLGLKNWLWWKRFILPGIFPYLITGVITAVGGAWNATIIAEYVQWGDTTLKATGLGAYITEVTTAGDFPRVALGIATMCIFVLIFNRLLWQPLYNLAEKRFQLD